MEHNRLKHRAPVPAKVAAKVDTTVTCSLGHGGLKDCEMARIGVGRCFIVRGPNLFSVESGT